MKILGRFYDLNLKMISKSSYSLKNLVTKNTRFFSIVSKFATIDVNSPNLGANGLNLVNGQWKGT